MKNKRNSALIVIIVILAIIIVGVVAYFLFKQTNIGNAGKEYTELTSSYVGQLDDPDSTNPNSSGNTSGNADNRVENPIDFKSLKSQNDEIYSWIYIPDTNINYPVCQSNVDDNFYLDHGIDKNYSFAGTIYTQVCNSKDYSDRVTLLYGHNMADGSMFADLHKYSDINFLKNHEKIYIYTQNQKLTYQVVSAFVYDDRHIMNSFNFSDDKVFQDYLDMILNPRSVSRCVNDNVSNLNTDNKVITLSTCVNSGEGRFLVQGVLINEERTK